MDFYYVDTYLLAGCLPLPVANVKIRIIWKVKIPKENGFDLDLIILNLDPDLMLRRII